VRDKPLSAVWDETIDTTERAVEEFRPELRVSQVGRVAYVGEGIARVRGLPEIKSDELIEFSGDLAGTAFNLDRRNIGVVLFDDPDKLTVGARARGTGRVVEVPVGEALLGRTVDAIGRPRDNGGPIRAEKHQAVEQPAPAMMDRDPVEVPLQTGIKAVDALIPIGRGQRELILGDRQTGKTAIALDTFINQRETGVICIYCAIGKKSSAVARFVADLKEHGARDYTTVVVAGDDDPPGLRYVAPYAATSMGEHFMRQGRDVLIVYDDLSRHARAYRELSLLLRRPPGREAYPGDIFYVHSRLLERATHLDEKHGGGSLTALPVIETQAQNLSAYIPTNLISITDGQIYLSPQLFRKGVLPAIDVSKSVSRVGGKTQLPAYRDIAGDLKLSYSQFEELESFARFSTRLDEETRRTLERGHRVRESLKQPQYEPRKVFEQIAALLAVTSGLFDDLPVDRVGTAQGVIRERVAAGMEEMNRKVLEGMELSDEDQGKLVRAMRRALADKFDEIEPPESEDND
jgi:F-type H+-transporting ATPase subunit alpha